MAENKSQVMQNIQNYAAEIRASQEATMDLDATGASELEERLDRTIQDLQNGVQQQQAALESVFLLALHP